MWGPKVSTRSGVLWAHQTGHEVLFSRDPCTYHNLFNLCMTKGYPVQKTSRYILKRLMAAFGNHGNEWRVSVVNGCWNLKMKKRAEVDRLANQSLGGARFGASHLLLPVIVCCANIASFGDYFMYFRLVFRWSFLWRHNSTIVKGYHRCDYLEKAQRDSPCVIVVREYWTLKSSQGTSYRYININHQSRSIGVWWFVYAHV